MHKWVALIRMRSEKWKMPVFLCRFILAVYLCICTCVCLPMSESVTRGQQCLLDVFWRLASFSVISWDVSTRDNPLEVFLCLSPCFPLFASIPPITC